MGHGCCASGWVLPLRQRLLAQVQLVMLKVVLLQWGGDLLLGGVLLLGAVIVDQQLLVLQGGQRGWRGAQQLRVKLVG